MSFLVFQVLNLRSFCRVQKDTMRIVGVCTSFVPEKIHLFQVFCERFVSSRLMLRSSDCLPSPHSCPRKIASPLGPPLGHSNSVDDFLELWECCDELGANVKHTDVWWNWSGREGKNKLSMQFLVIVQLFVCLVGEWLGGTICALSFSKGLRLTFKNKTRLK